MADPTPLPPNPVLAPADRPPAPAHPGVLAIAALLVGNMVLALGAWSVRLADCGPISAGFWRVTLALPALMLLARWNGQPMFGRPRGVALAAAAAGVVFACDLASWHLGIPLTRLGNATVFGNSGAFILMVWGLVANHRAPRAREWAAIAAASIGAAILMGRSFGVSPRTLLGDVLCAAAGVFYVGYIVLMRHARGALGNWAALVRACLAAGPAMLAMAIAAGEPVWPHGGLAQRALMPGGLMLGGWGPLLALALGSQVLGQGLLVFALDKFSPLVIGLSLLLQPAVAVLVGWLSFGEVLGPLDAGGMVLVASALVLAGLGERR